MSGREEKARKGYWNGGQAPFGYRLVDKGNKFKELEVDGDSHMVEQPWNQEEATR